MKNGLKNICANISKNSSYNCQAERNIWKVHHRKCHNNAGGPLDLDIPDWMVGWGKNV